MAKPIIVCAHDLTEEGERALDLAIAFGRALDARVELLHATDTGSDIDEEAVPDSVAPAAEALEKRLHERVRHAAEALEKECQRAAVDGVECAASLVEGRPYEALTREITARHATLAVLGRRRREGQGYVGKTVDYVVRHVPCPVLVAPPEGSAPRVLAEARWVIGVDFSRQAQLAVRAAKRVVDRCGGELVFAHVVIPSGGEAMDYASRTPQQVLREEGNREAMRQLEAWAQAEGGSAVQRASLDRPADVLRDVAAEVGASIVCVGTHGRRGLARVFLGSTAERLLAETDLPVLVVRQPPPRAVPWFSPSEEHPVAVSANHLLVAVDFSEPSRRALELARLLAARLEVAVDVVHVHEPPEDVRRGLVVRLAAAGPAQELSDVERAPIREKLESLVADVFGPDAQTVGVHVEVGRPVERIIDAASARDADLIVVGTTGHGAMERLLLGSIAEKLVRTSPVPVLTAH